jgi:hypothetical protein
VSRPSSTLLTLRVPRRSDWRLFLTIEERQLIRRKISAAYEAKLKSYEELLQVTSPPPRPTHSVVLLPDLRSNR